MKAIATSTNCDWENQNNHIKTIQENDDKQRNKNSRKQNYNFKHKFKNNLMYYYDLFYAF